MANNKNQGPAEAHYYSAIQDFGFSQDILKNLSKVANVSPINRKSSIDDLKAVYEAAEKLDRQLFNKKSRNEKILTLEHKLEATKRKKEEMQALLEIERIDKSAKKAARKELVKIAETERKLEGQKKSRIVEYYSIIDKAEKSKSKNAKAAAAEAKKAIAEEKRAQAAKTENIKEQNKLLDEANKLEKEAEKDAANANRTTKDRLKDVAKAANALGNQIGSEITQIMNSYGTLSTKISTRLLGSDLKMSAIQSRVAATAAFSPYVTQMQIYENMAALADQGVLYNLEGRAFLQSISDKIATTFNAANGTLLRLIRIQQQDSTLQRMALEASLTELLNGVFEDSSYMTDNFDQVSATIIDAVSQLGRNEGLSFEYTVQKWLGALSSVGLSSDAINMMASAINMLGTGNVSGLSSNSGTQTLLALSTRGNYANYLTEGLNASGANSVLANMITYLRGISKSDNQVIRSQYAQMFGLSMSDLNALANMDDATMEMLGLKNMSWASATQAFNSLYGSMSDRTHAAQIASNIKANVMQSSALGLASNPITATMWQLLDTTDSLVNTALPFISALGSGVDIHNSITGLMKLGFAGIGLITSGVQALSGSSTGNGLLNFKESTTRGTGFTGINGFNSGLSKSQRYSASGNSDDISSDVVNSGARDAKESGDAINKAAGIDQDKIKIVEKYDFSDLGMLTKFVDSNSETNFIMPVKIRDVEDSIITKFRSKDFLNAPLDTRSEWSNSNLDESFTLADVIVMLYEVLKSGESSHSVPVTQVLDINNTSDVFSTSMTNQFSFNNSK